MIAGPGFWGISPELKPRIMDHWLRRTGGAPYRIAPSHRREVEDAREALRTRPRRRPRPRILASGVMEFWSTGVLRIVRIAPSHRREVKDAFRAVKLGMIRKVAKNLGCYSSDLLLLRILFDIGPPPTTPDNRFSTRIDDVYHQGSNFGLTIRCCG
jgi:hypothetical protein